MAHQIRLKHLLQTEIYFYQVGQGMARLWLAYHDTVAYLTNQTNEGNEY